MGYANRIRRLEAQTPVQITQYGRTWFVDAKSGSNSNSGRSSEAPFLTMAKAFQNVDSGDVIYFRGKVREQLDTPIGVFDVKIIGAANRPRHADDHTESGGARGSSAATWTAPASGSTAVPLLRCLQQGWLVSRVCFQLSGSATACIGSHRTDDSGDDERDGAHLEVIGCKIQGDPGTPAGIGFQTNGSGFYGIYDNLFLGFVTAMAKTGSAGGQVGWCDIVGNRFWDNTNGIVLPLYHSLVRENFFGVTTKSIDLTNGAANIVTENHMLGDYDGCVAGTGDSWFNNYSLDTTSGEISDTSGQSTSIPVA